MNNVYIHFFAFSTCVYTEGRMRRHLSTKILVHAHVSGVLIIKTLKTGRPAHLVTGRELLLSHMIVSLRDSLRPVYRSEPIAWGFLDIFLFSSVVSPPHVSMRHCHLNSISSHLFALFVNQDLFSYRKCCSNTNFR